MTLSFGYVLILGEATGEKVVTSGLLKESVILNNQYLDVPQKVDLKLNLSNER